MRTLQHFNNFVKEITASNSRLHKQAVLQKYKEDEVVKRYLQIAFDPFRVYGLSTKKLNKSINVNAEYIPVDVFNFFQYLEQNNTGRDTDIAVCYNVLDNVASNDTECAELLEKLICKDLSIGCDTKTINKEIPGLIPEFACQLAQKYFDNPAKLEGKTFAITTKLDGFRLIAIKDSSGEVKFYSRVGQLIEGLVEIEAEMKEFMPCNFALDGELTISNYFEMPSKDAYKAASKIIRLKGDTPKTGLTYRVFDCMTADEFLAQKCEKTYFERRETLATFAGVAEHIEVLPVLYLGDDTSEVITWLNKVTARGGEGIMLNLASAEYVWGRTWNLMKVKKFTSLDLEVVDVEEGSGRLAGTLGAIHVRYKNGNIVKVGSGFSDNLRASIWANPHMYIGWIAEIQYFEETTNATGGESLRFPIFKDFRSDKTEADF
jgi:DNA ligase-1